MSLVVNVARSDLCNTIARVNDAFAPAESKAKPPGNSFKTHRLPTIQLNLLTSESSVSKLGAFFHICLPHPLFWVVVSSGDSLSSCQYCLLPTVRLISRYLQADEKVDSPYYSITIYIYCWNLRGAWVVKKVAGYENIELTSILAYKIFLIFLLFSIET